MNAEHDVERAIAGWLQETAIGRAPDRVLEQAGRTIDRTKQRRRAAWRNEMSWSMPKLIAAGVAIVAIALAGGLIGRSTAGTGTPAASSSPEAAAVTIASYRLARNEICAAAQPTKDALSERYATVFDAGSTDEQRADGIVALEEFIALADDVADDLTGLAVPPDLAGAHHANVAQYRDLTSLIRHYVNLVKSGRVEEAAVVDQTADVITVNVEGFERANQLTACP